MVGRGWLRARRKPSVGGGNVEGRWSKIVLIGFAFGLAMGGCDGRIDLVDRDDEPPTFGSSIDDETGVPSDTEITAEQNLTFSATTAFCCDPLAIKFVIDPGDRPSDVGVAYEWDFGDGRNAAGLAIQHSYVSPGDYLVSVVASTSNGPVASAKRTISLTGHAGGGTDVVVAASDGAGAGGDAVGDEGSNGSTVETSDVDADSDGSSDDGDSTGDDPDDPGDTTDEGDDDAADDLTPPVANAGSDQSVEGGSWVQLHGTGSTEPPSQPVSYLWSQKSGPAVALTDATTSMPAFVAPSATDETVALVFELQVSASGLADADSLTIWVVPEPQNPEQLFPPGVTVAFLTGPAGAADPGPAAVSWTFVDDTDATNVILRKDCCECNDVDSAALAPDPDGVYHATIDVPPDETVWYSVLYTSGGVEYRSQTVYVNPPSQGPPADPPPVIWYHSRSLDPAILHEVVRSGIVTHVLIGGGDRVVQAHDDPTILEAIAICQSAGLSVIWSRHLWNNWEDLQTLEDAHDPNLYASAIAQIRAEADALGAPLTAMDCEAYINAPLYDYLREDVPPGDAEAMAAAIEQAVQLGQVDFVYPTGSHGAPQHANAFYPPLGRTRIAESTYWDVPHKNCRITYPYEVFGAFVQPTTERPEYGIAPYFLPYDVVQHRHLWSQADGAPPAVNGLFIYPGSTTNQEPIVWDVATMLADFFEAP